MLEWVEYRIQIFDEQKAPKKVKRFSDIIMKRYNLHQLNFKKTNEIEPYFDEMFELLNQTYNTLQTFVPIQQYQVDHYKKRYLRYIHPDFIKSVAIEKGRTVLDEAYQAFTEIKQLELKQSEINLKLSERTDYESKSYFELITELGDVTDRYELIGGYNYQGQTEKILQGLGFNRLDFNKNTDTFSGGWRMRIELAKLLLQNNDLLLLDEPTNHLDIESIIWLEQFLKTFPGAVVIVSHDKMFLNMRLL